MQSQGSLTQHGPASCHDPAVLPVVRWDSSGSRGDGLVLVGAARADGPRLVRFRVLVTAEYWAKAALAGVDASIALMTLQALLGPDGLTLTIAAGLVVAVFVVLALVMIVYALGTRMYRHDVHRHGLVLHAPGRSGPEVIPWATIDPGRTFIGTTIRSGTRMPAALHRQRAAFPPVVMINGWTKQPRGGIEAVEAFTSGYIYRPMPTGSPFGWWQLGVRDPGTFLAAIEAAMVADGHLAAGLTHFALGRKVTARDMRCDPSLQQERRLIDPVLGLPPGGNRLAAPSRRR